MQNAEKVSSREAAKLLGMDYALHGHCAPLSRRDPRDGPVGRGRNRTRPIGKPEL